MTIGREAKRATTLGWKALLWLVDEEKALTKNTNLRALFTIGPMDMLKIYVLGYCRIIGFQPK